MIIWISAQKKEILISACVMECAASERIKRIFQKTAVQSPNDFALMILSSTPKNSQQTLYANRCTPECYFELNLGFWFTPVAHAFRLWLVHYCILVIQEMHFQLMLCWPFFVLPLLAMGLTPGKLESWHLKWIVFGGRQATEYFFFFALLHLKSK